jgi:hypothetical protein
VRRLRIDGRPRVLVSVSARHEVQLFITDAYWPRRGEPHLSGTPAAI